MKKILTHLYNRLFKRNKSFIVWINEKRQSVTFEQLVKEVTDKF